MLPNDQLLILNPKYVKFRKQEHANLFIYLITNGRTLPRTLRKRELHAPGCPFYLITNGDQ